MKDFEFKKKFGQNFLTDKNLLNEIADKAEISCEDTVVEVGAGKGALTEVLSSRAKKVIAFEIDNDLKDYLTEKFSGSNVELIFGDALNFDDNEITKIAGGSFKLVANLPYYITSPLLTKFLKIDGLVSATVMVQEEVADRIVAQPKTKDYGVLTVICKFFGEPKKVIRVSRNKFTPVPNVDSAVVHISKNAEFEIDKNINFEEFINFVKKAFAMRRKKLSVNLSSAGLEKAEVEQWLENNNLSPLARAEELGVSMLIKLFEEKSHKID